MYSGVKKRIRYSRAALCPCEEVNGCKTCAGSGVVQKEVSETVEFPAGINKDQTLRLKGKGNYRREKAFGTMLAKLLKKQPKCAVGDLHVNIREKKHDHFERSDLNLIYRCEIDESLLSVTDATIELHHLSGENMKIKIPQHSESGKLFRIKGYGFKSINADEYGDLFIEIQLI